MENENTQEIDVVTAQIRAVARRHPAFVPFLERLLEQLKHMEDDDRTLNHVVDMFDFCQKRPDMALLLACFGTVTEKHYRETYPTT